MSFVPVVLLLLSVVIVVLKVLQNQSHQYKVATDRIFPSFKVFFNVGYQTVSGCKRVWMFAYLAFLCSSHVVLFHLLANQ